MDLTNNGSFKGKIGQSPGPHGAALFGEDRSYSSHLMSVQLNQVSLRESVQCTHARQESGQASVSKCPAVET